MNPALITGELDTWDTVVNGVTYRVDVNPDPEADPTDGESGDFTPAQVQAWEAGAWRFAVVTLTAVAAGVDVAFEGCGATPYGLFPDHGTITDTRERAAIEEGTVPFLARDLEGTLRRVAGELARQLRSGAPPEQLILAALAGSGEWMTQPAIQRATGLPRSAVDGCTLALALDEVISRKLTPDHRTQLFRVKGEGLDQPPLGGVRRAS